VLEGGELVVGDGVATEVEEVVLLGVALNREDGNPVKGTMAEASIQLTSPKILEREYPLPSVNCCTCGNREAGTDPGPVLLNSAKVTFEVASDCIFHPAGAM
jgi:hypothetical protein